MALVTMFKMPFSTRHFNTNQHVWVVMMTGNQAAQVAGRFRGNGRYITAWVRWESKTKQMPQFKVIDVTETFAARHGLLLALKEAG